MTRGIHIIFPHLCPSLYECLYLLWSLSTSQTFCRSPGVEAWKQSKQCSRDQAYTAG